MGLLRGAVYACLWLISQDEWTNGNWRPPSPSTGCCLILKRAIIVSLKIFDATEGLNEDRERRNQVLHEAVMRGR